MIEQFNRLKHKSKNAKTLINDNKIIDKCQNIVSSDLFIHSFEEGILYNLS